jgi:uncharacterized membrane protein
MAYTLSDPFRPLRFVLRFCGAISLLTGLLFLLLPSAYVAALLSPDIGPLWPLRLAGAGLLSLGLFYLLAANERAIRLPTMVTCVVGNGLPALLVVVAYLQQEMTMFSPLTQALMLIIFVAWLTGAVAPLRYLRAEYRAE